MKKFELALAAALLLAVVVAVFPANDAQAFYDSMLRLHIRANSDSEEDQAVKLRIRDRIIRETEGLFDGCSTPGEAAEVIGENLALFEVIADRELADSEMDYKARADINDSYFPTRSYGDVTLPAGTYQALVIELGEAKGENWWCVMFPPLCYSGETLEYDLEGMRALRENLSEEDYEMVTGSKEPNVVLRFKILELLGQWFGKK